MLEKGRLYVYLSVTLIIVTFHFIYELEYGMLEEAFFETMIVFPLILILIFIVYSARDFLFKNILVTEGSMEKKENYKLYIIGAVVLKTLILSILVQLITDNIFIYDTDKDIETDFFDLTFAAFLIIILVIILFVYFFEEYLISIKEKHRIAMELSAYEVEKTISKYHSLKKQLNPHFLFNSFNSLITLIPINTQKAEKFVEELSSIYRYNLSKSDDLVVKLSEELDMVHSYIHLQKIRFGNALIYKEIFNYDSENMLLPPMTLQLLIENVIKHNKINHAIPLMITVLIEKSSVTVTNSLQFKEKQNYETESFGLGLDSLKNQLKIISNIPLVILEDEKQYSVKVPLIKAELYD